ncbi:MAG: heparinase II/III family protein, partial [Chitinophagaceae bacterium]
MTVNSPEKRKEFADPQTFVDNINQKINQLALDAAIVYWLEGDAAYAKFAADILSQWARGAYYQSPIKGPCRTGFLSIQTLGDGSYEPMPLIYDFLYDYLRENSYETKWYETVFDKIAHTMTFRGFWNNNWFAAQSPALVFSALALEDKQKRDYYLSFVLERDTINGGCGHLSLPSVVKELLTPDGHWKEPGGYHNYPISSLLIAGLALENNGYPVFKLHPELLDASYVMLKYSFPNLMAPSFGDTGPSSQSPLCLEIGIRMAQRYSNNIADELISGIKLLQEQKGYRREKSDYLGLLCYLPEIKSEKSNTYTWPRSGSLDFAKAFLQRNGTDKKNGLMYVVQGASYNHNHANGMSVELYGLGSVMGPDPGNGLTYEDPLHVGYYTQWAAHNTVIAGGRSTSIPQFKGGGGTKQIGEINLKAMEPLAGNEAISTDLSFTITGYIDKATGANQERTLSIIRTSSSHGYYLDLYRSDHSESNTYIYHNIGEGVKLLNSSNQPILLESAELPLSGQPYDPPGMRYIQSIYGTGNYVSELTALFTIDEGAQSNPKRHMKVIIPSQNDRSFFTGMAPPTKTVDPLFITKRTPTLIAHQKGEAWKRPFVAVYEPFSDQDDEVKTVEYWNTENWSTLTALKVKNKNLTEQIIFQSTDPDKKHQEQEYVFTGTFGIAQFKDGKIHELYLGNGKELSFKGISIISKIPNGSASLIIDNNHI